MKRALQAILIAGEEMRDSVKSNDKQITIREGHRDYTKGPVLIGCHILDWAYMANIVEIRHTILDDVKPEEYQDDGFQNYDEMKNRLRQWYPALSNESDVTVIRWEAIE